MRAAVQGKFYNRRYSTDKDWIQGVGDETEADVKLSKPLLALFNIKDKKYHIEYEGLHILYLSCGRYGHYKKGCKYINRGKAPDQDECDGKEKGIGEGSSKQVELSMNVAEDGLWKVVQKQRKGKKTSGRMKKQYSCEN
ncbi:hypothetical protein KIW84_030301 [Lathyrus oleraceus]|uniref:CCHC-type domain-containing protein n=1 Tax=Pisum sativum TaxID=3888 RepID=A0A9D5AZ83_PEA|nr:hypothetical protein KIW84_030301 [Pisum sativum]